MNICDWDYPIPFLSLLVSPSPSPSTHNHPKQNNMREDPTPNGHDPVPTRLRETDAGAQFVLQSKGEWWHAGYHLTTAIVGPLILSLPYVFRGLGWGLGFFCLTIMGVVTFYAYYLMSLVLDFCERNGRRHIRFRELAADVLGSGWMFYFVIIIQTIINTGIGIGSILLSAQCVEILYSTLSPHGSLKFYHFVLMVTAVMIILSQIPSFHSLRHINLGSTFLSLGYTFLLVGACIHAATSRHAPPKDYSLDRSKETRVFNAFSSISIIASIFGNGILPEIQATLAAPAAGKMLKGLALCYIIILITFYSVAVSGYYAFGNKSASNVFNNLLLDNGTALAPTWVLGLAVTFVLLQLFAIGLIYSQVAFEIMEKKTADTKQGMFSRRNLIPRLILRTTYMLVCGFLAAMLPFFGDINAVVGAIGFIPLDFILPMLLYNMTYKPPKTSYIYWINLSIIVIFSGAGLLGAFSSMRQLILDANQFKLFSNNVM